MQAITGLPGFVGANAGTLALLVVTILFTMLSWKATERIETGGPTKAKVQPKKQGAPGGLKQYTKAEIKEHNTTESLWLIIEVRFPARPSAPSSHVALPTPSARPPPTPHRTLTRRARS